MRALSPLEPVVVFDNASCASSRSRRASTTNPTRAPTSRRAAGYLCARAHHSRSGLEALRHQMRLVQRGGVQRVLPAHAFCQTLRLPRPDRPRPTATGRDRARQGAPPLPAGGPARFSPKRAAKVFISAIPPAGRAGIPWPPAVDSARPTDRIRNAGRRWRAAAARKCQSIGRSGQVGLSLDLSWDKEAEDLHGIIKS